jgi:N-acetylmuramoyl-L-alanine amidase
MAPWYTVKQGEDLLSIAEANGLAGWEAIYDHPENAAFREKRPDPTKLFPGDRVFVPNRELKQHDCETEKRHTFQAKVPTALIRVVLEEDGEPLANKKYELSVGGRTYEGTTDAQGLLEHKVRTDAETGRLKVWLDDDPAAEPTTWTLQIAHLDPIDTISGVQARLTNLGYDCGGEDGTIGPYTEGALKAFQARAGLEPTGQLDDATRTKLKDWHDSV